MVKTSIILLCSLAYSLTLVHSVVPHHHHDKITSELHQHDDSKDHRHHDDSHDQKSVRHAFADAIHFPGSDIVDLFQSTGSVQKTCFVLKVCSENLVALLPRQLKPPDLNSDDRQRRYLAIHYSLFLLRAPPVA
jgi:hypothetical protein